MEQVDLALRIYRVGTEIAPCTRCENSVDPNSKPRRCVALPEKGKNSNRYTEYTRFRKSCDVRLRNRMPLASEWSSIDR
jgi:hypothetical protein